MPASAEGSIFEGAPEYFYDHTCKAETRESQLSCHTTATYTDIDCITALDATVGSIAAPIVFTRVPWNESVAAQFRIGPVTTPVPGAQISVLGDFMTVRARGCHRLLSPASF